MYNVEGIVPDSIVVYPDDISGTIPDGIVPEVIVPEGTRA